MAEPLFKVINPDTMKISNSCMKPLMPMGMKRDKHRYLSLRRELNFLQYADEKMLDEYKNIRKCLEYVY
jgi:hypothetical protein